MIFQQPQFSPVIAVSSNQWSTGICGCFDDCNVCCFGIWCPFCFICSTASDFGEFFCLPLIDNCACTPPVSMALRASVRNRYGIQGGLASDCMYVTFCNICSWCQIARELKRRHTVHMVLNAQPAVLAIPPVVSAPKPVVTTQVTTTVG
ncbi:placenta-specific gene 8 protein-like [Onychostoma macrolepis]|uniref:placenta-specific gene 8 protein-like n=1 Tax=Onychostoma macrolepis TaxID=369639 RepID=UPI00272B87BA|nr:placenta-specific gene 8 protein-like [Onychostoma macrolepis]